MAFFVLQILGGIIGLFVVFIIAFGKSVPESFFILSSSYRRKLARLPYYQGGSFLFGSGLELPVDGAEFLKFTKTIAAQFRKDGIFRIRMMFFNLVYIFRADQMEILISTNKNSDKCYIPYHMLNPWLGEGLVTSGGELWHQRRRMLTPSFHFNILNDFIEAINDQVKILVERLDAHVGGSEFDAFPMLTASALDVIAETAMGNHLGVQSGSEKGMRYANNIEKMSTLIINRFKNPFVFPDFVFFNTPSGRLFTSLNNEVVEERKQQLLQTGYDEDAERLGKKQPFLDHLLIEQMKGASLTDQDIRDEVDTFMFAGHDTTAATMTWAVLTLAEHPEIQDRVFEEVSSVCGEEPFITRDHIRNFKYLECVIKEVMRFLPTVPMIGRKADDDIVFEGGYVVPKGQPIVVFLAGLHSDPEQFPNPERFDPDRFLLENSTKRHPFAFIPFSGGPRNCIGQKFALMEMKVTLSQILRHFRILPGDRRLKDNPPVGEVISRPKFGAHIKLAYR